MSPKDLKKLAKVCRDSGIRHYKCTDFEFELTDEAPIKINKKQQTSQPIATNEKLVSEDLTEEALLFWSSGTTEENVEQ